MSTAELTPTRRALAASFEGARATYVTLRLQETPTKAPDAHGSLAGDGHAAVKFARRAEGLGDGMDHNHFRRGF